MPNPNDIERFVLQAFGCPPGRDGAVAYIRDYLQLPPGPLTRDQYMKFYDEVIESNPAEKQEWDRIHSATETRGFISNFFFGSDDEPAAEPASKKTPPPTPAAPSLAPTTVIKNAKIEPLLRVQERVAQVEPAWSRMSQIPPPPAMQGAPIVVNPVWDPRLAGISSVDYGNLPGQFVVDQPTYQQLVQAPMVRFNNAQIPQGMVQFLPSPYRMQQQLPWNPPFVGQTITYSRRTTTETRAKSGAHSARAERHTTARRSLDDMLKHHRTIY